MKINWMDRELPPEKEIHTEMDAAKPARKMEAWLDEGGRLRMRGLLPEHCSILELLVGLDAGVEEIERHIGPVHHVRDWKMWTGTMMPEIKLMGAE